MTEPSFLPEERYFNRESSWIDFNDRVLELAESPNLSLLVRVKFLAIFAGNLDEFYMVRVAGLKRQVDAGLSSRSSDGRTPREQLRGHRREGGPAGGQARPTVPRRDSSRVGQGGHRCTPLERLSKENDHELPPDFESKKGSTWALMFDRDRLAAAECFPPPRVEI